MCCTVRSPDRRNDLALSNYHPAYAAMAIVAAVAPEWYQSWFPSVLDKLLFFSILDRYVGVAPVPFFS